MIFILKFASLVMWLIIMLFIVKAVFRKKTYLTDLTPFLNITDDDKRETYPERKKVGKQTML